MKPVNGGRRFRRTAATFGGSLALLLIAATASAQTHKAAEDFVLTAAGDSIIMTKLTGEQDNLRFQAVVNIIKQGDAAFTALEKPIRPTSLSGGDVYRHLYGRAAGRHRRTSKDGIQSL